MPRGKKKIQWAFGDLFTETLKDGSRVVGQTLDLMMPHIVSVALTNVRLYDQAPPPDSDSIGRKQVHCQRAVTRSTLVIGRSSGKGILF